MPEYLAPGVYVEETSFRSKSIEGVSTSTTAFVGLARKGPVSGSPSLNDTQLEDVATPEIITSFVDFERVFGGFDDLALSEGASRNHLAHAVNAFFANGGSRLYVARVSGAGAATAESERFPRSVANTEATSGARFVARVSGAAGNGKVLFSVGFAPVRAETWKGLPVGTVHRTGGGPAGAAQIVGGNVGRILLRDGDTLVLAVNSVAQTVTLRGAPARVRVASAATVTIDDASRDIALTVGGLAQTVRLTNGVDRPLASIVAELNASIIGASVSIDGATDLVFATDVRGRDASIAVPASALGVATAVAPAAGDNNVANLVDFDVADLDALLTPLNVRADRTADGAVRLTTLATGQGTSLAITGGTALAALGLSVSAAPVTGTDGASVNYAVKANATDAFPGGLVDVVTLSITAVDADGHARVYDELGFDPRHPRFVGKVLPANPSRRSDQLEQLLAYDTNTTPIDGAAWAGAIVSAAKPFTDRGVVDERYVRELTLSKGADGSAPTGDDFRKALKVLERLDDISIVAAPGYAALASADDIEGRLIAHAEKRRAYRIAVLDARAGQSIGEVRDTKARVDSKYAALYYPWVVIANPLWRPGDASVPKEIAVPPSGFVAGIYARNDVERGVFKTPANEVVRGALRFESDVNFAQQEVLNPLGVNCLRFFPGRGYRVWGGRTTSSDPEWKYVSVRRYFNYLERSIDVGTQWAVFEPNGERLWANIKETISSFLFNEWRSGALLGSDPKEAFFVRCDRSTMDQNDLDNGRLVCLIGVAVVKPAEFVIFRIGQKTADARS